MLACSVRLAGNEDEGNPDTFVMMIGPGVVQHYGAYMHYLGVQTAGPNIIFSIAITDTTVRLLSIWPGP